MLTPEDPFTFIDLDDVIDPETGEIEPWAMGIVEEFGSYTEISPLGRGLRIAVRGKLPVTKRGTPPVEVFSQGGYVTITGNALPDFAGPITEAQDELEDLYERYFPAPSQAVEDASRGPLPDPIDLTDGELIEKARRGRYGREFVALNDMGDTSAFGGDESRADNALAVQYAFWTAKDPDRIERLIGQSALGQREKWKTRPKYRRDTINRAIANTKGVYEPEQHRPNTTHVRDELQKAALHAHLLHPWGEKTGSARSTSTDYFSYLAMLRRAHRANTLEIDYSTRDHRNDAGIGNLETAAQSLTRLHDLHGLLEKVRDGDANNPAQYRIKKVSIPEHIEIGGDSSTLNPPCGDKTYVPLMTPEGFGAWLIRHPSPTTDKTHDKNGRPIAQGSGDSLRSLGKPAAMALNIAHVVAQLTGMPVPARFLASRLGTETKNFKRRHGKDLAAAKLLKPTEDGKGYVLPEDVGATLERELRDSGALRRHADGLERTARDRRYRRIKKLWWLGMNRERIAAATGYDAGEIAAVVTPPDEAPTREEMDAARLAKGADGPTSELVKESPVWTGEFPDPDDAEQPLGHGFSEAPQTPVSCNEPVQRGTAPPDKPKPSQGHTSEATPCKHSYGGHVYPGGRGCYCCDAAHPMRQYERENGVVSLDAYRRRGAA